ncbi:EAL domain-containing protein [Actinoplanes sp. NPDC051411]|uniref:putative bifunctional diguanylate cyclase/phosphodiesterase n=1 Tax=Actinoplanes sp. NPDC051411 TaxID=3155522 RepID=UPI003446E3CE
MSEAPPQRLSADAKIGVLTAVLVAVTLAVQAVWLADGFTLAGHDVVRLAAVALLFAAAEKFVVTFPVRRGAHTISLSEIPLVLGLATIAPPLLVAVRIVGGLAGLTAFRRQGGSKLAFNTALYGVQATAAGAVFHLVARSWDPLGPTGWIAAFAATFTTDVISIVLISAVIALHDDSGEWRRLLTADVRKLFQLPLVAVTTTLGLVTAIVVREQAPAAVLLAVLSLAIYRVLQRYAQQTQGHTQVEALYEFTRSLNGPRDADEVARVVLSQARDLVRAESAELVLADDDANVRIRLAGQDDFETGVVPGHGDVWWGPARLGEVVFLPAAKQRVHRPSEPIDAMAVPVALGNTTAVLIVTGSLPDIETFTPDHLRLMRALAAHAGVALTNVRLLERLRHISVTDALTGLPNRRKLLAELQQAAEVPSTVGVLLLDLDRFKEVNDALGHTIGDRVLREVGNRLQHRFAGRGTVARLGGDEFAMIISGARTPGDLLAVADEVRRTVEEPIPVGDLVLRTQASIGVCLAPEHGSDPEQLLQRADVAMYAAKQARSGVRVYQAEDDRNTPRRLSLLTELRTAVETGAVTVVYQPKVEPASGRVLGAEALSRWRSADGPVPPDEFIPLAERSGLILPLTRHVLNTALAACADWRRAGHDLSVAVNLSPQTIADQALIGEVRRALAAHGVPAEALTLEITETGVMEDPTRSLNILESLRALGVRLSVDDFGTGHSSLGRLADLPVQEMKIDKGFVQDLTTNRSRQAVTDASLHLGHALGLHVVAEGAETQAEFEHLRRLGCDSVQGYYISRPLPADQFLTWLETWHRTMAPTALLARAE